MPGAPSVASLLLVVRPGAPFVASYHTVINFGLPGPVTQNNRPDTLRISMPQIWANQLAIAPINQHSRPQPGTNRTCAPLCSFQHSQAGHISVSWEPTELADQATDGEVQAPKVFLQISITGML